MRASNRSYTAARAGTGAVLALLLAAGAVRANSPPVSISLETGWPAPPLILEILETVYDESPSSYFPLLHLLSSLPTGDETSPESLLSSTLDLISSYSLLPDASSLSTFNLALSLHTSVPKVQAEYAWYESALRPRETQLGVKGCEGWVEWRGKGFCAVDELRKDMEMSIEDGHHLDARPVALPFDHVSPSSSASPSSPQAVLYFTPSSTSSSALLNYLAHHASTYPDFSYVVRYLPPPSSEESHREDAKTPLSGWGVEMALKKTDYLVVDDRAAPSPGSQSEGQTQTKVTTKGATAGNQTDIFGSVLAEDPWAELSTPLTTTEIKDLGLKAATLIMSSDDPLEALTRLSQDFPKYSAALARQVQVPDEIRARGRSIWQRGKADSGIWINGKLQAELNAYSLLKNIRAERDHVLSLTSLGLTPKQAVELISDPVIGEAQTEDEAGEGVVDASDRYEGGDVVVYWNDIEKDKRYKDWPAHVTGYMRQMYPGQFHSIRRNTWNLIFLLDLAQVPSLEIIASSISTMVQRGLPLRFGIVPMFEPGQDDISSKMAKVFHYVVKTFGRGATRDFLSALVATTPSSPAHPGVISLDSVKKAYDLLVADSTKAALPFEELLSSELYDAHLERTEAYMTRLLVTKQEGPNGHLFFNGKHTQLSPQWPVFVQTEMASQLGFLQGQLMLGDQPEELSTYFYDLPSTSLRRNKLINPGQGETKLKTFNLLDLFKGDVTKRLTEDFVYPEGDRGTPITMWVVGDLDTKDGQRVVVEAVKHLQTPKCSSRLGFIHIPIDDPSIPRSDYRLSTALYQLHAQSLLSKTTSGQILELVENLNWSNNIRDVRIDTSEAPDDLSEDDDSTSESETKPTPNRSGSRLVADFGMGGEQRLMTVPEDIEKRYYENLPYKSATFGSGAMAADIAAATEFWKVGLGIASTLGLRDGRPHLLVNGRLVGPLTPQNFALEDYDSLEVYEHRKRVKPVIDLLKTMYEDISVFDRSTLANLISMTSSVIAAAYKPLESEGIFTASQLSRDRYYRKLDDGTLSFTLGDLDTAILEVAAVIDPISENAQRWSTILRTLSEMENVAVTIYIEPTPMLEEVKLKRFYRSSLPSRLSFDVDGNVIAPGVTFNGLPATPIYTLGLDAPSSWIVSPRTSPYDLDNLVLSHIQSPVHITFQLKQLLIEGHAREASNAPPRGLQLQLTTNGLEVASDTQVMANLGYFQFKATPGVYDLSIRPGRGTEVYELESVGNDGWDSASVNETGTGVILDSFEGVTVLPRFVRKEGMERADVLQEVQVNKSESFAGAVFSRMKEMVGLSTEVLSTKPRTRHADVNIFTVASGLLYERFASIMILSVMKHTNSSVKFWFIENFLSPTFIEFIPKLAEEYGFQYEFVTYKWPHWLRAQTEKQRIIWAYKILFLDVLFPMDLDKVIFVDADQIVRTDMKELVDTDLHGRVYGYAPMGDSRTEMEGFRFWKTGYWKDALRGRPYHISALYVVDLKRFRQLATGDRLRGQYHALSADPNSLANLDQDLPNSMQDTIPIFTLGQDWLWCQTWCSDESLSSAKTIDLCQNPLTKEPKLVRARQIPEWDLYDQEIARFASSLSGQEGGTALAISVDELASEAGGAAASSGSGSSEKDGLVTDAQPEEEDQNTEDEEKLVEELLEESSRIGDEL